jgi:VWFA-related protein
MSNPQNSNLKISMGRLLLLTSIGLLCILASSAFPRSPRQQVEVPRSQRPTFQVQSNLVVVDLSVRDRKGNPIADLKKEDFKVYEDNVAQEIITFASENVPVGPAATITPTSTAGTPVNVAGPAKPAPAVNLGLNPYQPPKKEDLQNKRLIILFFDLSSLSTEDLIHSVDTAHEFIAKQSGPQDLVAIAVYNNVLALVQDFTNDRDLLLKTLNVLSSPNSGDAPVENLGDPDTSDEVFVPDTVQFNIFNTDRRLAALETLAKMYREFPERKSLLYFSSGVTTTGVENNAQIRSTVDTANRSNMSIYSVDSRGLVALPPGGAASQRSAGGRAMFTGASVTRQRTNLTSSQETLTTLAHDTGGRAFTDSNDLSLAFKQVQADTQMYYVLGYFSSNPKEDGKYRKIRVEVMRPDLKVEHRPGYFASKAFSQLNQQERDMHLQQAMSVDRPFSDVPVILQVDYFRQDNNTSLVPISIELAGDGVKFEDKGSTREAKFEFLAQVSDPKGRVTGVARDQVQVKLPAERAEKIKSGGIFYSTGFQLRPGDYNLKFLVRDNGTGKLGGFEQSITVPALDPKKLDTSSIVLGSQLTSARGEAGSGVAHQGMMRRFQELGIGYDPLVIGDKKIVPSIGNIFLNQQTVYVFFQVYGAEADQQTQKPAIETSLTLLKDDTLILESEPQFIQDWTKEMVLPGLEGVMGGRAAGSAAILPGKDRKGEATVAISLPLKNLKKGTYTLQIHVRDTIGDVNLFRRVPIVIH